MFELIRAELYKLKRSYMLVVSLLGSAMPAVLNLLAFSNRHMKPGAAKPTLARFLDQTDTFTLLLIATMLYGLLATYILNREWEENTIKQLLIIPIGRIRLLLAKMATLFLWIMGLNVWNYIIALALGTAAGFTVGTPSTWLHYLPVYLAGGAIMFLCTLPVFVVVLLFRAYVPAIAFTISATLGIVFLMSSDYAAYYPWNAAMLLLHTRGGAADAPVFSPVTCILSVAVLALLSLAAAVTLFRRMEIR